MAALLVVDGAFGEQPITKRPARHGFEAEGSDEVSGGEVGGNERAATEPYAFAVHGSFRGASRGVEAHAAIGVDVANIVSPGWVDTPMFDELVGEAKAGYFEAMAARLPIGRIAAPPDVAPAYLYALENEFMTGETIHVDGGQRLIRRQGKRLVSRAEG